MLIRQLLASGAVMLTVIAGPGGVVGDEVRYYEKDGVTYRETRRIVDRPVSETRMKATTETVYREQTRCELHESVRNWWTPVTEYRYEPHLVGRWNPFVTPYMTSRLVPRTRWEQHSEVVQVPVTCRRLVPETRTLQVPVTVCRTVPEEVITRTVVGPASSTESSVASALSPTPATTAVRREAIGGVARLEKDPPREGMSTAWRAESTLR